MTDDSRPIVMDGKVGLTTDDFDEMYDALGPENLAEIKDAETHVYAELYAEQQQRLERYIAAARRSALAQWMSGDDDDPPMGAWIMDPNAPKPPFPVGVRP